MNATNGRGVDVIVELLANVNLGKDLTILAKGGRVAIVGSRAGRDRSPRHDAARCRSSRNGVAEHSSGGDGQYSRSARSWFGKWAIASGDRQRIPAGRSGASASCRHGVWSAWKNRAGDESEVRINRREAVKSQQECDELIAIFVIILKRSKEDPS